MEKWKQISKSNYEISNAGNLRHKINGSKSIYLGKRGYLVSDLYELGKRKNVKIHRLVAKEFIKNKVDKLCVNHIDGNKLNNNSTNLEWVTHKENTEHAIKLGLRDETTSSKLSIEQVHDVRKRFKEGQSLTEITECFDVTKATICRIVNNKIWKNI